MSSRENSNLRLIFFHTPKCGGTSVDVAIREPLSISDGYISANPHIFSTKILQEEEFSLMTPLYWHGMQSSYIQYMYQDKPIISGHFPFSEKAYNICGHRYAHMTVLRDPVERWISHYRFAKTGFVFHLGEKYAKLLSDKSLSLEEQLNQFINSPVGSFLGMLQCAVIGGYNLFSRWNDSESRKELVKNAKKNLKFFKVIGFLEDIKQFEQQFYQKIGYPISIPTRNKTIEENPDNRILFQDDESVFKLEKYEEFIEQDKRVKELFNPEIRQRIRDLCVYDEELYQEAKNISLG